MKESMQREKTPEEEIKDFITEMDLGPSLSKEFETLDKAQKLKVVRDLKQRIVDIVKSDAKTQYSEDVKGRGGIAKIRASINKESEIKNFEIKAFATIKNTEEGKKLIAENLILLTKMTKGREVSINKNKPEIIFISPDPASNEIEKTSIADFNVAANNFREVPYEWEQEKSGKHKKEYEKAKAEYEKARDVIFKIEEKKKGKEATMIDFLQLDNFVKMDQLINTHPEFETELNRLSKSSISDTLLAQGKDVWNIGGKGALNKTILVGGYGARWLAKGAALASGVTIMTGVAAVAVGGIIGGIRGRIRGKQTLEERQKEARHGKKDTSEEKIVTTDATHLSERLEKLIQEIKNTVDEKEQAKKLSMLSVRIEHTMGKIEKGQVNLGDSKSSLVNEYNLVSNLNKALVLRETMSEKTNKELQAKINLMLTRTGSDIAEKTSETQKKFINKQMLKGAAMGAGFATAGYALRYIGENLGWWGGSGTVSTPKGETVVHPASTQNPQEIERAARLADKANGVIIPETPPAINADAIVHQGQGIEHPLIKQIENNFKLAQELGFKGDINDKVALHKFAGGEAHRIAEKMGYVGEGGKQIHITEANKVAFELKVENGHPVVTEKTIDGKIIGIYDKEEGYKFGKNVDNQYEKEVNTTRLKPTHYDVKSVSAETPPTKEEVLKKTIGEMIDKENKEIEKQLETKDYSVNDQNNKVNVSGDVENQIIPEKNSTPIEKIEPTIIETHTNPTDIRKPSLGYKTVGIGRDYTTGSGVYTGTEINTGSEAFTGGLYGNQQPIIFNGEIYYSDAEGHYHDAFSSKSYFPEITPEENVILQRHPEFAKNPFNLSGEKLMQAYDARAKDMNHLFTSEELRLSRQKVSILQIDANESTSNNPTIKHLSNYVISIKNFTGLEPKTGLLGWRAETTQDYLDRAYQKLAADGKLEQFQENLRSGPDTNQSAAITNEIIAPKNAPPMEVKSVVTEEPTTKHNPVEKATLKPSPAEIEKLENVKIDINVSKAEIDSKIVDKEQMSQALADKNFTGVKRVQAERAISNFVKKMIENQKVLKYMETNGLGNTPKAEELRVDIAKIVKNVTQIYGEVLKR